ncbi:LysR substrate-binding domain-containing protein [Paracoccus seriniphilus]|uniref:LysR family transcriptional regulator, glycine cleavage system transcriptional activator n=1 Tax=Paracoccus seriniphilus TaxID=184748 RepID=A0A239PUX6_9RHOB|nr:LysR substrate-binding domain-containing protein [Paracoccus seriniphilus]WCR15437.1 LysR family transcriptional regulator [Paracoccus seriniphilus]SNT73928.1 LysR family transcriptional regulator, glycine cleavage system transcriptional activator [Paracoccus seriniphilus]
MSDRPFRLPPLNALRVFHTAVRHRSFRSAADDLLVTPQAVSQQIKLLEETLGLELFERKGRVIEPNEQAILLAHYVQSAFEEMEEGVRRVTKVGRRNRINVNASPYFATRYLLDRIAKFRETLTDSDLRLTTMVELPDFVADDVDVAIQWGYGSWKPYESTLLMYDYKEICCTPDIARKMASPEDLASQALLHPVLSDRLWPDVLSHLGLSAEVSQAAIRFQDAATMRRATVAGLGVGLISTIDADEDLKLGKLVAPFGRGIMRDMAREHVPGFYLVLPRAHRRVSSIAAFCKWIAAEDWAKG